MSKNIKAIRQELIHGLIVEGHNSSSYFLPDKTRCTLCQTG
jgi:hypothetical protein